MRVLQWTDRQRAEREREGGGQGLRGGERDLHANVLLPVL